MTARLRTHIDLDEVEASPWACGPHTRQALVNAARALIAIVEHEHLDRYEVEELNEPWASESTVEWIDQLAERLAQCRERAVERGEGYG